MTGPYEPYGQAGGAGPDDLERMLAAAMHAHVDRVVPAGDGLAKIRARTEARAGVFSWLTRPAAAGGIVAAALVAATVVGIQFAGDDKDDSLTVEPAPGPVLTQPSTLAGPVLENAQQDVARIDPTPEAPIGAEGGDDLEVNTQLTDPPALAPKLAPVTPEQERNRSDNGIPVDNGGTYVSIEAPLSGGTYSGDPLTLAGRARVFEANVTIDISQNGRVVKQGHATATEAAPALADWQATFTLAPGAYRIDAYALSPEDGTTKLFSDSIWITIGSAGATPTPSVSSRPSSTPSARPTSTPTSGTQLPQSDVPGDDVAATEPY